MCKLGFVQFFMLIIFHYGNIIRGPHGKKLYLNIATYVFLASLGQNAVFTWGHHSEKWSTWKTEQNHIHVGLQYSATPGHTICILKIPWESCKPPSAQMVPSYNCKYGISDWRYMVWELKMQKKWVLTLLGNVVRLPIAFFGENRLFDPNVL